MTGFVCKIIKTQRCQPLEISNLEIFFRTSIPLPPPPTEFANMTPTPSPTEQFRGKTLSIRDFKWLNTHPIRLSRGLHWVNHYQSYYCGCYCYCNNNYYYFYYYHYYRYYKWYFIRASPLPIVMLDRNLGLVI